MWQAAIVVLMVSFVIHLIPYPAQRRSHHPCRDPGLREGSGATEDDIDRLWPAQRAGAAEPAELDLVGIAGNDKPRRADRRGV